MLAGIELRDQEGTCTDRFPVLVASDRVRHKREFGRQCRSRRCGLDDHCIRRRHDFPIWIGRAKRCCHCGGIKPRAITKSDTAAKENAPTLVAALTLPGSCKMRLRHAAVIESD